MKAPKLIVRSRVEVLPFLAIAMMVVLLGACERADQQPGVEPLSPAGRPETADELPAGVAAETSGDDGETDDNTGLEGLKTAVEVQIAQGHFSRAEALAMDFLEERDGSPGAESLLLEVRTEWRDILQATHNRLLDPVDLEVEDLERCRQDLLTQGVPGDSELFELHLAIQDRLAAWPPPRFYRRASLLEKTDLTMRSFPLSALKTVGFFPAKSPEEAGFEIDCFAAVDSTAPPTSICAGLVIRRTDSTEEEAEFVGLRSQRISPDSPNNELRDLFHDLAISISKREYDWFLNLRRELGGKRVPASLLNRLPLTPSELEEATRQRVNRVSTRFNDLWRQRQWKQALHCYPETLQAAELPRDEFVIKKLVEFEESDRFDQVIRLKIAIDDPSVMEYAYRFTAHMPDLKDLAPRYMILSPYTGHSSPTSRCRYRVDIVGDPEFEEVETIPYVPINTPGASPTARCIIYRATARFRLTNQETGETIAEEMCSGTPSAPEYIAEGTTMVFRRQGLKVALSSFVRGNWEAVAKDIRRE